MQTSSFLLIFFFIFFIFALGARFPSYRTLNQNVQKYQNNLEKPNLEPYSCPNKKAQGPKNSGREEKKCGGYSKVEITRNIWSSVVPSLIDLFFLLQSSLIFSSSLSIINGVIGLCSSRFYIPMVFQLVYIYIYKLKRQTWGGTVKLETGN